MHSSSRHFRPLRLVCLFVVASCSTCETHGDLRREFELSVASDSRQLASFSDNGEQVPADWRSSVCIFGQKHGEETTRLCRELTSALCTSDKFDDNRLGAAALEALACSGGKDGARLAEQVFRDPLAKNCGRAAMDAWIRLADKPVSQALGGLLLDKDGVRHRAYILSQLVSGGDSSALPFLHTAALDPQSVTEATAIERTRRLLADPMRCILMSKSNLRLSKRYSQVDGGESRVWACQYRCSGLHSDVMTKSPEECLDVIPNPNRADGGR